MSNEFKLDINIPQKNIEQMAKQVIREIIEEKIQDAMKNVDIEKVIQDKLQSIDPKLSKTLKTITNQLVSDIKWDVKNSINQEARKVILEEIQKKPLSGNVYLKIGSDNVETDEWD